MLHGSDGNARIGRDTIWTETTLVLVEAQAGGETGIGYSYADVATGKLVESLLSDVVKGTNAFDVPGAHTSMLRKIRNLGRPGIASMAISAVDNALWDLKCRLLGVSLLDLLGAVRESALIYGSGGFTSYSIAELQKQLGGWAAQGIKMVKMKIGREPAADFDRVRAAREAIGPLVELCVDANGAYSRKQALAQAERFAELDVRWFEEPVSSDDLEGLRLLRDRAPAGMNIAAGEYGYDIYYFRRMLAAGAVDVLQADATRCGGIYRLLAGGRLVRGLRVALFLSLRPCDSPGGCLCSARVLGGRILFRPRSHRKHAFRRCVAADRWRSQPRSFPARVRS